MLVDGSNMELTNYGTYIRRPGLAPYSTASLSAQIKSFYSFRQIASIPNPFDVIVDTAVEVDVITPSLSTQIFSKQASEINNQCYFQGVGNVLYMGTGSRALAWCDPNVSGITQGVRNWGISIGPFSGPSGPSLPGTAADVSAAGVLSITLRTNDTVTLYCDGTNLHYQSGQVLTTTQSPNSPVTGSTYTIQSNDNGTYIICNNASGVAVTMPLLGSPSSPFIVSIVNSGAGNVVISNGSNYSFGNGVPWFAYGSITTGTGGPATVTVGSIPSKVVGPLFPTAAIDYMNEWQNPFYVEIEDGNCATITMQPGTTSSPLQASGFGFTIPSYAKIIDVTVSVKCAAQYQTSQYPGLYGSLQLLGVGSSNAQYDVSPNSWPGNLTWRSYDGVLWGSSLTPDLINSSAFGVSLIVTATGYPATQANVGEVDAIKIAVTYSLPSSNKSDLLEGTNFGFNITSPSVVQGIQVQVNGYQGSNPSGCYLTAQLLLAGQPTGNVRTVQLGTSSSTISIGGAGDFWGIQNIAASSVGGIGFGVALQAFNPQGTGLATWYITWVKITIWATGGPPISIDTTPGTFNAFTGYQYVAAYGNSKSGHVSSTTPPSTGTGIFTNATGVKVTLLAPTDPQVDQIWVFRITDGGSIFLNIPTSPYLCTTLWPSGWTPGVSTVQIEDNSPDISLIITQPGPVNYVNNPPPSGIVKMAYHLGRIWGAVGNLLYYSAGPDCLVGNGSEAFPPLNYFTFPTQINRLVPTSSALLVWTQSDLYYIAGSTLASMYPMPMLTGLGLSSYNALAADGVNTWLYSADRQFIRFSAAGINEDGFAIGNRLEIDPAYNPSTVYVASLISGSSDKAVFLADGSSTWYRCNWNQPPEGGPAWSPKAKFFAGPIINTITTVSGSGSSWTYTYTSLTGNAIVVGDNITVIGMANAGNNGTFPVTAIGSSTFTVTNANGVAATGNTGTGYDNSQWSYTSIGSVETAPGVHQLLVGVWNSYTNQAMVAYRTPPGPNGIFTDLGNTYTGSIILGSLVLAQPGQIAEIESITVELPNKGSIPTVSVILDEVYDYLNPTRISFEALPNSVSDPPILTPSTSIMSKRFYLLQGAVPIIGRHIQMQIAFPAEAVRNELYTLSVWGSLSGRE
jgi:hypothetical protein